MRTRLTGVLLAPGALLLSLTTVAVAPELPAAAQEAPPSPSPTGPSASPSPTGPSASPSLPPVLTGTLTGTDGRAVNALLGFDWLDAQGRRLHRSGCLQGPGCEFAGYGTSLRVNSTLPATGTPDTATATTSWSVQPPVGASRLFLEAYPQNPQARTDESRYGHAMRHGVALPVDGPLDLRLPLVLCQEGGRVGTIRGSATKGGAPVPLVRVVAWSLEPYDPVQRPVLGWNIGTASQDGTFVVPNLVADQRYQVWVTATDGTVNRSVGVRVASCTDTTLPVSFDPPPAAAPTPSPSPSPTAVADPPPDAPVLLPAVTTAGQPVEVDGAAAREGQPVELLASVPGGEPVVVRTGVAGPNGRVTFVVYPQTATELRLRTGGEPGAPSVVAVRPVVSVSARLVAPRTYRLGGRVSPARGQSVELVLARDRRLLATTGVRADGTWTLDRRFLVPGAYDVLAATRTSGVSAAGSSRPLRLVVR